MTIVQRMTRPIAPQCQHDPRCPGADATDHAAARVVSRHPEQGWSLLCNGVVIFDDDGELLPDGTSIGPRGERAERLRRPLVLLH